jgi:AAA domain, putative AbiEii toxin, Type IV TA system
MLNRGSEWKRWEPHIHGPGTVLNNQYGANSWDDYLAALESTSPVIEAIAVTDYYVTDTYERVLAEKKAGRLAAVQLIFPNIELRLDVAAKDGFVNMHLFVSPEAPDHIAQLQRLLVRLQFAAFGDRFDCTRTELIRLGKKADPSILDDGAALSLGASQFKVNFRELRTVIGESDWARDNILVAVAGGSTDGTAGVREAADKTIREEIERFAHVIFASNAAQREFWLGRKSLTPDQIRERYNGLKPCLHGSDAHKLANVAAPIGDRFSWVKGGLEFDALRQACIDPSGRAFVGSEPPRLATPSQVIANVRINNASWAKAPVIPLNPGLVAVIGARGSGKTALVDIIAAGCDAIREDGWNEDRQSTPSFLARARLLLGNANAQIDWASGKRITRRLDGGDAGSSESYPRARYLSQQFVEDLCSSNGMSDGLLQEMQRVIFEAHAPNDRDGADGFDDLLDIRASRHRLARSREEEALSLMSERIAAELEKEKLVPSYEALVTQKEQLIAAYETDRAKLVPVANEAWVGRHTQLTKAAESLRTSIRAYSRQRETFATMQDEVGNLRRTKAPEMLRQMQARHQGSGMNPEQWAAFLVDYKGDVDKDLKDYVAWADAEIAKRTGTDPPPPVANAPYIAEDVDLAALPLTVLDAEKGRLESLMSADTETRKHYAALTAKLTIETSSLQAMKDKLGDARGARDRAAQFYRERDEGYRRVFEAILTEQTVLEKLYEPLKERLAASAGTLNKLSFSVRRVADVQKWATEGEELFIDRRKQGSLRGIGSLVQHAEEMLRSAWETGSAADVGEAMAAFRERHQAELLSHAPVPRTEQAEFRAWSKRFAQWLFGTDHIRIEYGIEYDGVDIRKLSPGTRGIVLLLLYLALDDADDRPLIIDQPEENLDPKSVFDELVPLFIKAKQKRQVIMVTHNANLVINTDADQIIIAEAGSHPHGELPPITYHAGGLDNADIRKAVCDILEGGEAAFQERARRLRVRLAR